MEIKYKVRYLFSGKYEVIETTKTFGERISVYESSPDIVVNKSVFDGSLSDCYAFIKLREGGYL